MHKTKVDYLNEEILMLKRQNHKLQCMLSEKSQDADRSFIFQLKQENQQLYEKIKSLNDQLLLQRQSRIIQNAIHQQSIQQYNLVIFSMKEQIKKYQSILKQEPKVQQDLGIFQKWVRGKIGMEYDEVFHNYADPILFFNILQEILSLQQGKETMENSDRSIDNSVIMLKSQQDEKRQETKWFQQQSQIYFIRKKRTQDLRLNLQKAKLMQLNYNRAVLKQSKQQQPLNNHKLLKQSYVNLIVDYQKQRKKVGLYNKYIQQLQNRNRILIESNIKNNSY